MEADVDTPTLFWPCPSAAVRWSQSARRAHAGVCAWQLGVEPSLPPVRTGTWTMSNYMHITATMKSFVLSGKIKILRTGSNNLQTLPCSS